MRYRPFGDTGLQLSVLGLGTWPLGGGEPGMKWGKGDDQRAVSTIRRAVEVGVTWLDTAPAYGLGHSERVIGRALRGLPDADRPLIFTKCGLSIRQDGETTVDLSDETIRRECEGSLERLGVDRIDLLQIHWPGDDDEALEEAADTLSSLRAEGKIRMVGVCNMSQEQLDDFTARMGVAALQSPLSMIRRDAAGDFGWCDAHGVAGLAYSPLQCGLLSGRFSSKRLAADDWRRQDATVRWDHQREFHEPCLSRNLDLAARVVEIADELGASPSAVAIAWVLAWPGVTGAIVGARDPHQVEGWLAAGDLHLDSAARDALTDAIASSGAGAGPRSLR